MNDILILDGIVADKIAAGEVIERPASVVKELVENAIDAGPRHVHIEITGAGKDMIRVKDDGAGIRGEQAPLAFSRHATSKIREPSDLSVIRTLGFRGEALPSIASVARVELITHFRGRDTSVKVEAAGGKVETLDWHAPGGTEVVVRDLFYNTPARHKFLKSDTAERRAIVEYVTKVALAHPNIAFTLVVEGDERVKTPGTAQLKATISALFGKQIVSDLLPVEGRSPHGDISGYVGKPKLARGNRGSCFVFINGRWVENRMLYVAVEKGFDTLLAHRRYPFAVLHIDMDPTLVDVNVHPAKTEVRFRNEQDVFRIIMRAVRSSLTHSDLTIGLTSDRPDMSEYEVRDAPDLSYRTAPAQPSQSPTVDDRVQSRLTWGAQREKVGYILGPDLTKKSDEEIDEAPSVEWLSGRPASVPLEHSPREILMEASVLGQLANTYLLIAVPEGLWLVDQHVAHERILFEEFLDQMSDDQPVASQELLTAEQLTLSPVQAATLEQAQELLERAGFLLEPFGGNDYLLRAAPVTALSSPARILMEMIDELSPPTNSGMTLKERTAASLACRAAVKAGDPLQPEESTAIIRSLALLENPYACPHGRPIIVRVTREEIERRFGRR